jgi:hypothetical protein
MDLHIAIACNASPIKATLPNVRRPRGGGQSESVMRAVFVSLGMFSTRDRKGSAQVRANRLSKEILPSFVSVLMVEKRESLPSRIGHETMT